MYQILSNLGLTEKDFKVEIVEIEEPDYFPDSFHPTRCLTVKINGNILKVKTSINFELAKDLQIAFNIDLNKELDKILKPEAINYYINSNQYIRKMKLQKINKMNDR
jgi:phenylalanyl-tRNA synthetase beta subunit